MVSLLSIDQKDLTNVKISYVLRLFNPKQAFAKLVNTDRVFKTT